LRLKFPAFIQQERCWILPAFSPWAGGVAWLDDGKSRIWLCTPRRLLRVDENRAAA
jgi:metallophosphoesterase superfamily enzyme